MDSLSGHLLIASPAILDPNFRRTVVFITAHTEDGAVGLILNRPSETTVGEAVPQLASVISGEEPVFVGGPVNPNGVAMLAEFEDPDDAGVPVVDDIGYVALDDALESGPPPLGRTRVFAGVAGCATTGSSSPRARTTSSPKTRKICGARSCGARAASTSSSRECRTTPRSTSFRRGAALASTRSSRPRATRSSRAGDRQALRDRDRP